MDLILAKHLINYTRKNPALTMTAARMNLKLTLTATVAAMAMCATAATGQKPAKGEPNMEKKNYYC